MNPTQELDALTEPYLAQRQPYSECRAQLEVARASGVQDEAHVIAQRFHDCIRARPPLPFDPSMIDDLQFISSEQRLRRILIWHEAGVLTPTQLKALLAETWSDGGWPADIGKGRLTRAFKHAGFVTDTEGVTAPTAPLTLYRGAGWHNYRGLAWTIDERIAAWFARLLLLRRPGTDPCLFATTIAPKHVLGIFYGRNEAEVVINPFTLRGKAWIESRVPAGDERVIRLAEEHIAEKMAFNEAHRPKSPVFDVSGLTTVTA